MNVGWLYHTDFLRHDTGFSHAERPERLLAIVLALERAGLTARLQPVEPCHAGIDDLCLVHDPAYVELLCVACQHEMPCIGSPDTPICRCSYEVACLAVGGVLAACDAVCQQRIQRAFCAVRPPGHHAQSDRAMGFCLLNNVAVAAEHLVRRRSVQRVAIVDLDVHHGNGTQHTFETRDDVLYVSLHERSASLPFPGTGQPGETGRGAGSGFTINIPLPAGSDDSVYRQAFHESVLPALQRFQPQFLLLSTGFDALAEDHTANMNLSPQAYGWMTRQLCRIADRHCQGRLVSVLEGGYELNSLARGAVAHVEALL